MSALSATADGYPDRGPAVFAVATATLVLATIFVAARLVSRIGIVRHVSADDYIICAAWLLAFFLTFVIDYGTSKGLGRHDANINPDDRGALRRSEYAFSILYNPALMATKTSILVFYLRLAKNTQKILRLASWAVLGIVNVAGTILTIMNIFQCRPVEASWQDITGTAQCIPLLTEFICSAPVNIVTDLAILALPIPVLTGMRLPPRQKTILVFTFTLGIFVTVVDVVRVYYLQQAITDVPTGTSDDPSAIFGNTNEFSWNASLSLMWSAVEVNIGMTCACIPTLKPLIIRILPAMLIDPDGTRRSSNTAGSSKMLDGPTSQPDSGEGEQPVTTPAATAPPPQDGLEAPQPARAGDEDEIDILDFLSAPNATDLPASQARMMQRARLESRLTTTTWTSTNTKQEEATYFGFVNLRRPKSMLKASASESFKYCTVVTLLFLLWGFSYGLLNTLNNVVAQVADMSTAQTLGLTTAYFGGGYFFGPLLVGEWLLRHDEHRRTRRGRGQPDSVGGFKTTFIVGLLIYGVGTIMFWPSAVLTAFGGFMVSNFVVGFGLGVLETAANPFIVLCGPMEYAEMRLLLSQGVQGVGSVLSGLIADNVFFATIDDSGPVDSLTLLDVQWTYLAVTLFCVLLALFFYYMPLPEVADSELDRVAQLSPVDPKKRLMGGLSLRTWSIILAVAAQWTYVAAQESMSTFFKSLITALLPQSLAPNPDTDDPNQPAGMAVSIPNYLLIAHTAFAISRFGAGYVAYLAVKYPKSPIIPSPRTMLTISTALSILFALLTVVLKPSANSNLLSIPAILFFFAEGPLWPLIFALGLRGQGKRTKRAAAWLTMGASGPAFWPFVMYAIISNGGTVQIAFIVVVALLVVTLAYPLFLTFVKDAKTLSDPTLQHAPQRDTDAEDNRVPEQSLDAVIEARRQMKEAESGGFFSRVGWRKSGKHHSVSSSTAPNVEHNEGEAASSARNEKKHAGTGKQRKESGTSALLGPEKDTNTVASGSGQRAREPWEDQALDTSILED